jgi:hypothetical protein
MKTYEARTLSCNEAKAFLQNMRGVPNRGTVGVMKIGKVRCKVRVCRLAWSWWVSCTTLLALSVAGYGQDTLSCGRGGCIDTDRANHKITSCGSSGCVTVDTSAGDYRRDVLKPQWKFCKSHKLTTASFKAWLKADGEKEQVCEDAFIADVCSAATAATKGNDYDAKNCADLIRLNRGEELR